ncbi:hypothetical protein SAMN04488518_102175 [Pseudovibrio ascidiaceicola]|uniref:Uncharacterized protein n=1 Tax=Pseudovibrio ascidiaceicola TaxID=285279 RepID=A0A1I3WWG9_9HYPH|nr:hypothetical protein SAMN04488518_102175 [Pseudovibrio ascidiaceicola]
MLDLAKSGILFEGEWAAMFSLRSDLGEVILCDAKVMWKIAV